MNYLEPWQLEGEEAVEIVVGTTRVAWTVDDDVFIYTGDKSEREDGYIHIGQLEWEDNEAAWEWAWDNTTHIYDSEDY